MRIENCTIVIRQPDGNIQLTGVEGAVFRNVAFLKSDDPIVATKRDMKKKPKPFGKPKPGGKPGC